MLLLSSLPCIIRCAEFLKFFSEMTLRRSDGYLDVDWEEGRGYFNVVRKQILENEVKLKIPSKYALSVCKYSHDTITASIVDDFKYKGVIIQALKRIQEEIPQSMILAIRMLTAWKVEGTIPEVDSEEDRIFFATVLRYYSQLKFDTFSMWTNPQVEYYK